MKRSQQVILFSVCPYTEGFERSEGRGSAQVCELLPAGDGRRLPHATKRNKAGGFIESNGGMFEHLQRIDCSSSNYTRESIRSCWDSQRCSGHVFLGRAKNITSFSVSKVVR